MAPAPPPTMAMPPHRRLRLTAVGCAARQGPNAESRRQVDSLHPVTPEGRVRLDPADAHEVLLLSDELQLDELLALRCLEAAHAEARAPALCF